MILKAWPERQISWEKSEDAEEWRRSEEKKKNGAVERTRTSTVLLPPAPQAGASASSATTALQNHYNCSPARTPKPIAWVVRVAGPEVVGLEVALPAHWTAELATAAPESAAQGWQAQALPVRVRAARLAEGSKCLGQPLCRYEEPEPWRRP
jgi:hypothetical protein